MSTPLYCPLPCPVLLPCSALVAMSALWARCHVLHCTALCSAAMQNLVAMSALWARCADVFTPEAASRLFGVLSAGG